MSPCNPLPSRLLLCLMLAAPGAARADHPVVESLPPAAWAGAESDRLTIALDVPETIRFAAAADPGHDGGAERGSERGGERVVKGAPYCAEAVHETMQWLPDGSGGANNRIVRQQSTLLCRDGEGRTRQEVQRGSRKLVYLRDPVAGQNWSLDVERKTARRMDPRGAVGLASPDGAAWRDYGERMREWARGLADRSRPQAGGAAPSAATPNAATPPTPPTPPTLPTQPTLPTPPTPPTPPLAAMPPLPVVISRADGAAPGVEVNVVRMRSEAGHVGAEWAMPPPAVQWHAQSLAPRGAGSVSPLGIRDIEGLRAHGERTTWVIEAGKVGNEKPIQITREVWTAPELMVTISSRDFDPRSGEVNYRLRNIKRGEPDAALMRVPADYKTSPRPSGGKASGATGQG